MIEKKVEKVKSDRDDGVELENQFILRLPQEVAAAVHEALESANLKDRMTIQMDNDLRYGEVRFDQWLLHAKILDLPTIIESLKTIDSKSFYKSADICQIMICKEEMDPVESEKESPNKGKKKDPNKVDKKYLWPHGITPPCKNIRKRRFRKTLKKKNVEAPEIEKEVKQLLRLDNDAVKVEYEIVNEDTYKRSSDVNSKYNDGDDEYNDDTQHEADKTNDSSSQKDVNIESDIEDDDAATRRMAISGVGEHDIFGGEVSSSDSDNDDDRPDTSNMMEDMSRMSADDSRMSDFSMGGGGGGRSINNTINNGLAGSSSDMNTSKEEPTEFNKSMFGSPKASTSNHMRSKFDGSSSNLAAPSGYFDEQKQRGDYDDESTTDNTPQMNPEEANAKILELRRQYNELKATHDQKAQEINNIQNATLRQRLQDNLDNLQGQMVEKELEIKDLEGMV